MRTIIIGAGLAGISTGIKLNKDFIILEKENRIGGLCKTEIIDGFTFDYTGHLLHLRNKNIENYILNNVKTKLNKIERKAFIFSYNTYTKYPYQVNNYGLPYKIIEENLIGFIKAKWKNNKNSDNFKKWVLKNFGKGIAKNFMFPYNQKLWKYPLSKLTINWMGRFVPDTNLEEILKGLLPNEEIKKGYNVFFYYPEKNGIESIIKDLSIKIKDKIILKSEVKKVDIDKKIVYFNNKSLKYDNLVVTMGLKDFLKITNEKYKKLSDKLEATSVFALNVGFRTNERIEKNWVYIPEKKYIFYRIGFPHTFSKYNVPEGFGSVFAEVSFNMKIEKEKTKNRIINDLIKIGVIKNKKDIKVIYPMVLKNAYVIYNKEREKIVPNIKEELRKKDIYLVGRWGNWEYSSMEDAINQGFETADIINKKG